MLWKILRHYGIPKKIVRMNLVFYDGFQARVLLKGEMKQSFSMGTGVRQGCLLSPFFFLVALYWYLDKLLETTKPGTNSPCCRRWKIKTLMTIWFC